MIFYNTAYTRSAAHSYNNDIRCLDDEKQSQSHTLTMTMCNIMVMLIHTTTIYENYIGVFSYKNKKL